MTTYVCYKSSNDSELYKRIQDAVSEEIDLIDRILDFEHKIKHKGDVSNNNRYDGLAYSVDDMPEEEDFPFNKEEFLVSIKARIPLIKEDSKRTETIYDKMCGIRTGFRKILKPGDSVVGDGTSVIKPIYHISKEGQRFMHSITYDIIESYDKSAN